MTVLQIKYYISLIMDSLLCSLKTIQNYREILRGSCQRNSLPLSLIQSLTLQKMEALYNKVLGHYSQRNYGASWLYNELRIFHWTVVSLSHCQNTLLKDFGQEQWKKLQKIFFFKEPELLELQVRKLLPQTNISRVWPQKQFELLSQILKDQTMIGKWAEVSKKLYLASQKTYLRSSKQCRQQWLNHLDLSKRHGQWTKTQDQTIIEYIYEFGKKWVTLVNTHFSHRTVHMVRNRYFALLRRFKNRKYQPNSTAEQEILQKMIKLLKKKKATRKPSDLPSELFVNNFTAADPKQEVELRVGDPPQQNPTQIAPTCWVYCVDQSNLMQYYVPFWGTTPYSLNTRIDYSTLHYWA